MKLRRRVFSSALVARSRLANKDHLYKTAMRYLEIAHTTAGRTGAIAFLWFVVMIVSWLSIEQGIESQGQKIIDANASYIEKRESYDKAIEKHYTAGKKLDAALRMPLGKDVLIKIEIDETELDESDLNEICKREWGGKEKKKDPYLIVICKQKLAKKNLNTAEDKLKAAEKELSDAKDELKEAGLEKLEFQLPGFPSFKIPVRNAPVLLSGIILLLAIYLTFMRERTFRYLGQALRILTKDLKMPIEKIGDVLGPRSWWVAPLPRKPGIAVSADDFAIALGWLRPSHASIGWIFLFWLTLLIVQQRLISIDTSFHQYLLESESSDLKEFANSEFQAALNVLYWVLLGITSSFALWWLIPSTVPDDAFEPEAEIKRGRRRFLTHFGVGIATGIFVTYSSLFVSSHTRINRPRFRIKKPSVNTFGPDGLWLNPRSNIVHLVKDKRLIGKNNYNIMELTPLNDIQKLLIDNSCIRLNRSKISVGSEYAAHKLLREDKASEDRVLEIMMKGIEQDLVFKRKAKIFRKKILSADDKQIPNVSLRLYDLLARESVWANSPKSLEHLVDFINNNGLFDIFRDRISKWDRVSGIWHRKIRTHRVRSSNVR